MTCLDLKDSLQKKKINLNGSTLKKVETLLVSLADYSRRYNELLNKEDSGKKMIELMKLSGGK